MPQTFSIANRAIGPEAPPYIIAEISGNHNGDIARAKELISMAKSCGADAVKLQTYTADTITIRHDGPEFTIKGGLWHGRTLHDLYSEAHTPWEWHGALFDHARTIGIACFSTPFDFTAVDLLESLDVPAYKIASFELIDLPLIRRVAATGKPMIMSTGMANLGEIAEGVAAAKGAGNRQLCLLHCISAYPAPAEDYNLATIAHLGAAFDVQPGLSDHTLGTAVPVAATVLGATVIEKHVTLARADGGPDAAFSLEPDELKRLVDDTRTAWAAKGHVTYEQQASEKGNQQFRRSLYAVADIKAGEKLTAANVRSIRPGFGLPPKFYEQVLTMTARVDIPRGTALNWTLFG